MSLINYVAALSGSFPDFPKSDPASVVAPEAFSFTLYNLNDGQRTSLVLV
jgi:hypothetical protein